LVLRIRAQSYNGTHEKVVEALTTNETSFFRDIGPFEALRNQIFPELLASRAASRSLNIWCAASSSGQEPYSIAILVKEFFREHPGWMVRILATDISNQILAKAKTARFTQLEVGRGLPAPLLLKYFEKLGLEWQLKDEIRRMVEFRQMNLTQPWPPLHRMDVIFLRNVLIYFSVEAKKSILARVRQTLPPDGYLFLGGAETTLYLDDNFQQVYYNKTPCYRPKKL